MEAFMVSINGKRVTADHGNKDVRVNQKLIDADQFLEVVTAKSVFIESIKCGGMKILSKEIFIEGNIVSHGPIVLAAMQIHVNRETAMT
jgi:hypothetical protein